MAKFKPGDWVQIEDKVIGVRYIGQIKNIVKDMNFNLFYSIDWYINEYKGSNRIQPTSMYPVRHFDKEGSVCPAGEVLYGRR